jgi:hypothetical protein
MKSVAITLALAAALVLGSCSLGGGGSAAAGGPVQFTKVSGSGLLTVRLLNAPGKSFMYGASGIQWGQYERLGTNVPTVASGDETYTIRTATGAPFQFAGGQVIGGIGGVIDENANGVVDNGDRIAMAPAYTVAGAGTVTFTYPTSFTVVSGSGKLTIRLLNAGGKSFMYGASGIKWGQYERLGGSDTSKSSDDSFIIKDPADADYLFAGGQVLGGIGGVIDEDTDGVLDDGDRIALLPNYTVNGDATITLNYPASFTTVSGSGYITVNVLNANTAQPGKNLMCGANAIQWGQYERMGSATTITSDSMAVRVKNSTTDYLFGGGQIIGAVGAIIDVNGDGFANDGDYVAITQGYVVGSGASVSFTY